VVLEMMRWESGERGEGRRGGEVGVVLDRVVLKMMRRERGEGKGKGKRKGNRKE
jgi:hypothetical protein